MTYTDAGREEMLAIKTLNLLDSDFGYNMTEGGDGAGVPGEESRRRMSQNSAGFRRDILVEELVNLYQKGLSSHQISRQFKTTHATVRRRLREAGVEIRPRKDAVLLKLTKNIDANEIIRMYRGGSLLTEISRILGICPQTVSRRLKALNEPLRTMSEAHLIAKQKKKKRGKER